MAHCIRCTSPASCDVWGCVPGTFPSEKVDPNPPPLTPGQQAILDAIPLRQPGPFELFRSASTSTTTATQPTTLNLTALEKLLADIPPEPIGEWMREQGFPPETSLAILPETMRSQLPFWPKYVRFSLDVSAPTLAKDVLPAQATVEQIWWGMAP